jgi:hypothetical protein
MTANSQDDDVPAGFPPGSIRLSPLVQQISCTVHVAHDLAKHVFDRNAKWTTLGSNVTLRKDAPNHSAHDKVAIAEAEGEAKLDLEREMIALAERLLPHALISRLGLSVRLNMRLAGVRGISRKKRERPELLAAWRIVVTSQDCSWASDEADHSLRFIVETLSLAAGVIRGLPDETLPFPETEGPLWEVKIAGDPAQSTARLRASSTEEAIRKALTQHSILRILLEAAVDERRKRGRRLASLRIIPEENARDDDAIVQDHDTIIEKARTKTMSKLRSSAKKTYSKE